MQHTPPGDRPAEGHPAGGIRVELLGMHRLVFDDGAPVRAASAIARLGDDWLIVQDDATHVAHRRGSSTRPLRIFEPVAGFDVFAEADGTKRHKPDLEAACDVVVDGAPGVLLFGSGSSPARNRAALVLASGPGQGADAAEPHVEVADLSGLYRRVAAALGIDLADLNIEGACRSAGGVRLFNRGNAHASVASASVDVDLAGLLDVFAGRGDAADIPIGAVCRYELGRIEGVGLAVTDAVSLPDGRILFCAAAEDTPNSIDDGPVVGVALGLLDADRVVGTCVLPAIDGAVQKLEGLALHSVEGDRIEVAAVVDADDPTRPSLELHLLVHLG